MFYRDKKKVIPSNIQDLLTPSGLAHLIMGDGFFHSSGVVILCSESFTKEEQEFIIIALDAKFGIKATLNKRVYSSGLESWRIRISIKDMDKLITLVRPYFIPLHKKILIRRSTIVVLPNAFRGSPEKIVGGGRLSVSS